jgi:hypothetical protein
MTYALLSLFLVGLLTPSSLFPSRHGLPEKGGILVGGCPSLLADWTPDDPPMPDPTRQTRQSPRAYLDNESSPNGPQPEGASAPGARSLAALAGPPSRRRDEAALGLPFHFPLIYALCTLLI